MIDLNKRKNRIIVTYHLNDGEIAPIIKEYDRAILTGVLSTAADGNDNITENPEEQARQQKIYNMEKDCLQHIKDAESKIMSEFATFRDGEEEVINEYKATNNIKDALEKILEKSLNDKAREKYHLFDKIWKNRPEDQRPGESRFRKRGPAGDVPR